MALEPWQEAWTKSPLDPLAFVEGVLGVQSLEPWQREALTALRDGHKRLSIRSGHGVGKTTFLAWLVLWGLTCFGPDTKIPIAAGSQDQLRDTIQPEIAKWRERLPPLLRDLVNVDTEKVSFALDPQSAFAVFRTASRDNPQALAGFHAENLMFLLDEASAIHEAAYEVALGALSTPGAIVVLTGNPTKSSGYFYDTHTLLRESYYTMRVSSEDVARARGHIDDVITRFGADSNEYRVRVAGEFPTSDDVTVIPLHLVEAALKREVQPMRVMPVWGLDVARFGDDRSALAKRRGNVLTEPIKVWSNKDTMTLAGLIVREWDLTEIDDRPHEILVDVIGIGAGVVDRLDELGLPVRGINVSESPSVDDQYLRLRDELWWKARQWFEARDCKIEADQALIAELTALHYKFTSSGKLQVESKADAKKRKLRSPDLADAFVLTFAADDRQRMLKDRHRRQEARQTSPWAA